MNQLSLPSMDAVAAAAALTDGATLLLDVREYDEWMAGHAPTAAHIAMSDLPGRVAELPRTHRIICVCRSGNRSARVVAWLVAQGFDAVNLAGGIQAWVGAGNPIVNHAGNAGLVI